MKNPIVIVLCACMLLVIGCQNDNDRYPEFAEVPELPNAFPQTAPLSEPVQAPDFNVKALDGTSLQLAELQGKTVLLNFWATWCGPCIAEIPDLIALQEELGEEDFVVVGLSMDMVDPELVHEFVDEMNVNYPIAIDEGAIAEDYGGIFSLPTTFIIDKEGKIQQRTIGIFPAEAFKPHLIAMIEAD